MIAVAIDQVGVMPMGLEEQNNLLLNHERVIVPEGYVCEEVFWAAFDKKLLEFYGKV